MIRVLGLIALLVSLPHAAAQVAAGDAPELGRRTARPTGVRSATPRFVARPDVRRSDGKGGFATAERVLPVTIWYPSAVGVTFAPWSGGQPLRVFSSAGLARATITSLFIDGDHDDVADVAGGVRWMLDGVRGDRFLLVDQNARHNVAATATRPRSPAASSVASVGTNPSGAATASSRSTRTC